MPTTAEERKVYVPTDHPAWNAIDDDDWNGATFSNWLRLVKGKSVVIYPPAGYGDRIGRFLAALLNAGAERIIDGWARFCEVTHNPCGTDTVHNNDCGCRCEQCTRWRDEELDRRWQELESLRRALSDCANNAAGFKCTSGMCSTEFLLNVPEEVRLQIGARERDRDANKAAIVRVEAERDRGYEFLRCWQEFATQAMRRIGAVDAETFPDDTETRRVLLELIDERTALMQLDTSWPLVEVLTKLCDAADHLLRAHDCDAHGWELVGSARDAGRAIVQRLAERRRA